MWYQALDQSLSAGVLFVDFSKAFDCFHHNIVINKLITGSIARSANLPVFRLLRGRF